MRRTLSRAERLRQIERLLYRVSGGLRATEIAEQLGVDRRTGFFGDLGEFMGVGFVEQNDLSLSI
jgi:hypothetical protein